MLSLFELSDLAKLSHATDFDPLGNEDVAVVIEAGAVRVNELASDEALAIFGGTRRVARYTFAQVRDNLVVLVEQANASSQVGDHDHALVLMEVARLQSAGDHVDRTDTRRACAFRADVRDGAGLTGKRDCGA